MKPNPTHPIDLEALREDIAETIIGHFPNASRSVMEEMLQDMLALFTTYSKLDVIEGRIEEEKYWFGDHTILDWKKQIYPTLSQYNGRLKELEQEKEGLQDV